MSRNAFRLTKAEETLYLKNSLDSFLMIPDSWHKNLQKESGKSYPLAELILSKLIYAYRPRLVSKDSYTHYFDKDLFQISYEDLSDYLCQTKNSVKSAVLFLENMGLIKRVFRTVMVGKVKLSNVLFISLDFEKILSITDLKPAAGLDVSFPDEKKASDVPEISDGGVEYFSQTYTHNPIDNPLDVKSVKETDVSAIDRSDGSDGQTNKDAVEVMRKTVSVKVFKPYKDDLRDSGKQNGVSFTTSFILSPDYTKDQLINERPNDKDRIDALMDMICDGFSCGNECVGYAAGEVRELTKAEFEHVLDRISRIDMAKVKNPRAYLYTAFLNARNDVSLFGGEGGKTAAGRWNRSGERREDRCIARYDFDEIETRLLNAG